MAQPQYIDRQTHLHKGLSCAASAVVLLFGLLVLCGWAFNVTLLKSVLPGLVTMKANTALGFVLAGAALFALATERVGRAQKLTERLLAGCVALLGLLTLSQYVFGWNLGIDQLLFREAPGMAFTSHPGRMAPATAFDFLLLGVALLIIDARRCRALAQSLALAAGIVAGLALVGYLYDFKSFYAIGPFTTIAVHTAALFVVLSAGVLLVRAGGGLMARAERQFSDLGFGIALLILLLIAIGAYRTTLKLAETNRWVTHSHQVIEQLTVMLSTVQDVETEERGYMITGDGRFLEPGNRAQAGAERTLNELRQLTADNPRQQAQLDRLRPLVARKIDSVNSFVALRRDQGINAAVQAYAAGEGRQIMDEIRAVVAEITGGRVSPRKLVFHAFIFRHR